MYVFIQVITQKQQTSQRDTCSTESCTHVRSSFFKFCGSCSRNGTAIQMHNSTAVCRYTELMIAKFMQSVRTF